MIKLNLGCGDKLYPDYTNIDQRAREGVVNGDVSNLSDFAQESVDHILADDIFEHFPLDKIGPLIREWRRVLKEEGTIQIKTPNVCNIFERYYKKAVSGKITWKRLSQVLYGGQNYPGNFHYVCFSPQWITKILQDNGFADVTIEDCGNQNMVVGAKAATYTHLTERETDE